MNGRSPPGSQNAPNVLLGVARLACGRGDGLNLFGDTPQAFLNSMAPLVAFPLVGGGLALARGGGLAAIGEMLATFCALLAPPVLSHVFARWWGKEALWLRFATAFNWCQWAIPIAGAALLLVLGVLMQLGMPNMLAGGAAAVGLVGYGLWLHWFIARHALALSGLRAAIMVLAVNFGTALLVAGPGLLALGVRSAIESGA